MPVFNQKSDCSICKIKLKLTKAHQSQGRLQMVMLRRSSPITSLQYCMHVQFIAFFDDVPTFY